MQELAHRPIGETEVARHLGARLAPHRGAQQRLALVAGQRGHAGEGLADHRAALGVGLGAAGRSEGLGQFVVVVAARLQPVQRRVVRDPVQPGLQVADLGAAREGGPRLHVRLLEGVLSARFVEHAPQVAVQRAPVALDDRHERPLMTRPRQHHEAIIGLSAQQRV